MCHSIAQTTSTIQITFDQHSCCCLMTRVFKNVCPDHEYHTNDNSFSLLCPGLSFSRRGSRPLFHSSPLLSSLVTHMLPTTKVPRCLKSPALISSSEKGDPCGIRLANHCLKPLWAHRPGDKDSRELYPALAGISGCLCWD